VTSRIDLWRVSEPRARTAVAALAAIVVMAAALRFWGLAFGFPHPFARPDEEVIVDTALGILRDPNPHFFDWPTLFMYATSFAYAVLFAVERAIGGALTGPGVPKINLEPVVFLVPRILSALLGTGTIAILYGSARELFSKRIALLAAGLLAVVFLHVRDSHFGVTDVPMTFVAIAAFWAGIRGATAGATPGRVALAGVLSGLAASTKYNAALILVPAATAIAIDALRHPRWMKVAAPALVVLTLSAMIGFLAGTPYAALDVSTFTRAVLGVRSHLANGHVVMARGWIYHLAFSLRYGVGVPLIVAAVIGIGCLAVRDPQSAALVIPFPVLYYVVLGSGLTVFVRYMIPIVPFLCLLAAISVDRGADLLARRIGGERVRDFAAVALAAAIAAPTFVSTVMFDRLMARTDTRAIAAEWIASRFPSGVSMYQNGYGYGHVLPVPLERFSQCTFDERTNRFERAGQPVGPPDLMVLLESPLSTYSRIPPRIAQIAAADYVPVIVFEGIAASRADGAVYDQDDMFFAPFGGIGHARRPGPNVRIFERRTGEAR
jgi:4-amino-4-deoxy-L-arabinose transferase-like glycosyltransferase